MARLVVVFSLHCAAVLGLAVGPYAGKGTGETALFRTPYDGLSAGDVVLADRIYASFWAIAGLLGRGVGSVMRRHGSTELAEVNRVRAVMAEAAASAGVEPRAVSFKGAVQALDAFAPVLALVAMTDPDDVPRLWDILLRAVARRRVGNRPDRYEPRAIKRRPKAMPRLTVPRDPARRRLARGIAEATTSGAKG